MPHIPHIWTLYLVYLLAAMSPGPNVIFVMRTAMVSRNLGLRAAWGGATATTLWFVAAIFGLSVVLKNSPWLINAIRLFGGAYLLYLGWHFAKEAAGAQPQKTPKFSPQSIQAAYYYGLATNASNPKAAVFVTSVLSFYQVSRLPGLTQLAVVGGISVLSFSWYSSLALAFSNDRLSKAYERLRRPLDALLAVIFCVIGMELMFSIAF